MDSITRHSPFGLLAAAYLLDLVFYGLGADDATAALVPLPLMACVFLSAHRAAVGAVVGAVVVVGTSLAIRAVPFGFAEVDLTISELTAGGLLVTFAVWRCGRWVAAGCVALLVAAGASSVLIRFFDSLENAAYLGLAVLAASIVAGLLLRMADQERFAPATRTFFRAQWPLAAVLAVFLLVDSASKISMVHYPPIGGVFFLLLVLASVSTAVCAFFGPRASVRLVLAGAAITIVTSMIWSALATQYSSPRGLTVPLTLATAQMALVAYVVRYAERRSAAISVAALVGADLVTLMTGDFVTPLDPGSFLLVSAFLLLLAMATGQYFRSRDRERNQTIRVAVSGAQQAERMALARELHDVVAHHVTGIVVQAQAARLVAGRSPEAAVVALGKIEHSGGEALAAMRMLVGSLRGSTPAGSSTAARQATTDLVSDLRSLAGNFAGPAVHVELELPETLPPEAGRSVLRLVQESLTNVTKHAASASAVTVRINTTDDELHVRVADDADGTATRPIRESSGYGLIGMRERVELLGGTFTAGPGARSGWTVDARFPLRKDKS
ncbi:MAG: sensor histidine kinase [Actinomycetota bacterium]|nr:sensor histidine kinase [Actinomycetota bacterium]